MRKERMYEMFRSFKEVEEYIINNDLQKRIALACAHDEPALSALIDARRKNVANGLLIGDAAKIREILAQYGESEDDYEIINEPEETAAAALTVAKVRNGEADIPMKGLMQTASFMRAILNKETGLLPPGKVLSQATVFVWPEKDRLMFAADCAVNIAPDAAGKAKILENTVALAKVFGIDRPKAAVISAVEKVNEKIPSTVDAAEIKAMDWADCDVDGPFALDIALDEEAASHKGVLSPVAGKADILLMPDLCAGNVLHKALHFFAHFETAGALCGTEMPVIMTSRTDTPVTKYDSILTAILQCDDK